MHPRSWLLIMCVLTIVSLGCSDSGGSRNRANVDPDRVSVSGTVNDINGTPVEGALVTITSDPVSATTDSQGGFVALVVPGSHTITITMVSTEIYKYAFTCEADTPMDLGVLQTSHDPIRAASDDDQDGYSENGGDCDDDDAEIHPGANEVCDDGSDNNCDGDVDCEDGDCASDPDCDREDTGKPSLLWVQSYDPEVSTTTWQYAGGVAVRMIFYQDFRASGESGSLRLTAAVKEEATDATHLAEQSTDVTVQAGQTYTLITEVDLSSWGSCDPLDWDRIVFSSPATAETGSINIYPVYDTDRNWYECVGRYAISAMRIEAGEGVIGSPVAGYWTGTAGFGQVEYRLASDGTAIDRVELAFQSFSCGDVANRSGSITITNDAGWPVSGDEFSIQLTLSHTLDQEMRLQGRFAQAGTTASGTYTADFNNNLCEGTWNAAPERE